MKGNTSKAQRELLKPGKHKAVLVTDSGGRPNTKTTNALYVCDGDKAFMVTIPPFYRDGAKWTPIKPKNYEEPSPRAWTYRNRMYLCSMTDKEYAAFRKAHPKYAYCSTRRMDQP